MTREDIVAEPMPLIKCCILSKPSQDQLNNLIEYVLNMRENNMVDRFLKLIFFPVRFVFTIHNIDRF